MDNKIQHDDNIVMGIDLGTRYSCVSIWRNNKVEVIPDQFGNRTMPSVVAFYKTARLVGHNALAMKEINPKNTIYDIKRIIGRRMCDPVISQVKNIIPYKISGDHTEYNNIVIKLDNNDNLLPKKIYKPEEICAQILSEMKNMVKAYLKKSINKAIITVPAYFNDAQRQATLDSAKIAGIEVLKIINEPTAAAISYGIAGKQWGGKNGGNVIIYDLGGGTLDVSLINISNGVFRTLSVSGNSHLGGEDIDYVIMNYAIAKFKKKYNITNLKISELAKLKLKNSSENAKKILSIADKAVICIDNFDGNRKLYSVITRKKYEQICNELFIMCIKPLRDVIDSANLTIKNIDDVILVGGSTRIPKIQQLILNFFKDSSIKKLIVSNNPDEVVSQGASIYGYIITHNTDPFSENLVLLDITPLSLGVETLQKQMHVVVPRNTIIPTKKTKIFSTDTDYQDTVSIKIFEGERKLTKNNFHVGTFDLSGFEKGPKGFPIISISFNIDINGILQVTANEKKSGAENSINITSTWGAKGRLSKKEIASIIKEAEEYEHIDTIYSVKIGLVHRIKNMCQSILINLKNENYHMTDTDKSKIKKYIKRHLKWLNKNDISSLAVDKLQANESEISKKYAHLIILINNNNNNFKCLSSSAAGAAVHGEDEIIDDDTVNSTYSKHNLPDTNTNNSEIKYFKQNISDMCQNIVNVINNPISNFSKDDITIVTDYMESVQIWLYTTNSNTTIDFVTKINEINKFTEEIIKKYDNDTIFNKNDNFTHREELQLVCLTLDASLKNKYFSLHTDDIERLTTVVNSTMIWLLSNICDDDAIYKKKIDDISELCNNIYNKTYSVYNDNNKDTNNDDSDSDSSDSEKNISKPIKINENITNLIANLPDKSTNCPEILLKIDIEKLNNNNKIKYKSF